MLEFSDYFKNLGIGFSRIDWLVSLKAIRILISLGVMKMIRTFSDFKSSLSDLSRLILILQLLNSLAKTSEYILKMLDATDLGMFS